MLLNKPNKERCLMQPLDGSAPTTRPILPCKDGWVNFRRAIAKEIAVGIIALAVAGFGAANMPNVLGMMNHVSYNAAMGMLIGGGAVSGLCMTALIRSCVHYRSAEDSLEVGGENFDQYITADSREAVALGEEHRTEEHGLGQGDYDVAFDRDL